MLVEHAAQLVIPEVGEAHDPLAPDAQDFVQQALHVAHRLERLREHHAVELPAGELRQPLLQVRLDHVQTALHARQHRPLSQFHAQEPRAAASARWDSSVPVPQPRSSALVPGSIHSTIRR